MWYPETMGLNDGEAVWAYGVEIINLAEWLVGTSYSVTYGKQAAMAATCEDMPMPEGAG